MYIRAMQARRDVRLAAMSDRNSDILQRKAQGIDCRLYADYRRLLDREAPDFVFLFGKHSEMENILAETIERKIPFCIEKPAGLDARGVKALARRAAAAGLFDTVAFVYRLSPFVRHVPRKGTPIYMYFRYLTGAPQRYAQWGCPWMLQRRSSGGGCLMNLGIHYVDLFRFLTGEPIRAVKAVTGRRRHGTPVEDLAIVELRTSAGTIGVVETGYIQNGKADEYYALRGKEFQTIFQDGQIRTTKAGREKTVATGALTLHADLANDCIERLKRGRRPVANLDDAAEALSVVQRAYADCDPQ